MPCYSHVQKFATSRNSRPSLFAGAKGKTHKKVQCHGLPLYNSLPESFTGAPLDLGGAYGCIDRVPGCCTWTRALSKTCGGMDTGLRTGVLDTGFVLSPVFTPEFQELSKELSKTFQKVPKQVQTTEYAVQHVKSCRGHHSLAIR